MTGGNAGRDGTSASDGWKEQEVITVVVAINRFVAQLPALQTRRPLENICF